MFWKDHLPPCQSLPYQLAKMAALAPLGADAIMPVECPTPLGVEAGPRRRSLAQVGSGGSLFLDKGQFLSTTTWPPRRAGSSQMEQRLPSSGLHWMTCVPTRQCHQRIFCSEIEVLLVKKRPYTCMLYIIFQTVKTGNNRNK